MWATAYRPRTFDQLVGQKQAVFPLYALLKRYFDQRGDMPAGLLFHGTKGSGKTTTARIVAAALNCPDRTETENGIDPCGVCGQCKDVWSSKSVSVLELDAASNGSVDAVRDLRDRAYEAHPGLYRVFILDEAHEITTAGMNALLKILEEPPMDVLFVLATTDPQKIIDTVLSRLMRFDFRRVSVAEMVPRLQEIATTENVRIANDTVYRLIAEAADGSVRDAIMMLEQLSVTGNEITQKRVEDATGVLGNADAERVFLALLAKDPKATIRAIRTAYDAVSDSQTVLDGLAKFVSELVLSRHVPDLQQHDERFQSLPEARLFALLETLWDAKGKMRFTQTRNLQVLEILSLVLMRTMHGSGLQPVPTEPQPVQTNGPAKKQDLRSLMGA